MISHIHSINSKNTFAPSVQSNYNSPFKKVPDKKIANFYQKKFKVMQFEIVIMKTRINLLYVQCTYHFCD